MKWLKRRRNKRKAQMIIKLKKVLPAKIVASRDTVRVDMVTFRNKVDPFSSQHARTEIIKILADKL